MQPAVRLITKSCGFYCTMITQIDGGSPVETGKKLTDQMQNEEELRCKCNKLICVIKDSDIVIKCNKCKRMMVIRTDGIKSVDIF